MDLRELIKEKHTGDSDQLDVIFSEDKSIIVTAPAGCGKTTTMISKIAWELSSGNVTPNKKILAMTYSVAGAMKIRDSLKNLLPELVDNYEQYMNRVDVSNYHQFAMRLLIKYGFVLHDFFKELYSFDIVSEDSRSLLGILIDEDIHTLIEFKDAVKTSNMSLMRDTISSYWDVLINKLIPAKKITYNGILVSAIKLLQDHREVSYFYKNYYSIIIVDEFQDTNYLGYYFLRNLIYDNRTVFMGDDVQRIYGFIGAVNNLFSIVKQTYNSKEYFLRTNYRFPANPQIKALDAFFRDYGEHYQSSSLSANVYFKTLQNDLEEAKFISEGIEHILSTSTDKVAVLVRTGYQGNTLARKLDEKGVQYFNCLYRDSDPEFEKFYIIAEEEFHRCTYNGRATIRCLKSCLEAVHSRKDEIATNTDRLFVFESLFKLLEILFLEAKKWNCTPEEKYIQIEFTLGNNGLKHMMEYMDERVVLSTVHAAKGLEWQYVIVPGLVSYSFPPSAVCSPCRGNFSNCTQGNNYCKCLFDNRMKEVFKEEISVFYVALTRAKKNVFFTANTGNNAWGYPKKISCIMNLPGLNPETFDWEQIIM